MEQTSQTIVELLETAFEEGASDLHISVGIPPMIRKNGQLQMIHSSALTPLETRSMAEELLSREQYEEFLEVGELDFSYSLPGVSRFRVNVFKQRGNISIAFRIVPTQVPTIESLRLPPVLMELIKKRQGLLLVTGPTGSGKSTTLAALIDYLNHTEQLHIVTLEDPIEYLHRHDKSIIVQREIGLDTQSFSTALRAALRQDPDVVLVGEMRDLETIQTAITAAETGHLVLATLHTPDAPQTIDRIIDVFPAAQQQQVRIQLAGTLAGIVSQRLILSSDRNSRVAAFEILVQTPAIANLIRTEKVHQIRSVMQTGRSVGMQTMDMHLRELIQKQLIREEEARPFTSTWMEP